MQAPSPASAEQTSPVGVQHVQQLLSVHLLAGREHHHLKQGSTPLQELLQMRPPSHLHSQKPSRGARTAMQGSDEGSRFSASCQLVQGCMCMAHADRCRYEPAAWRLTQGTAFPALPRVDAPEGTAALGGRT